jgi:hypothetical protein
MYFGRITPSCRTSVIIKMFRSDTHAMIRSSSQTPSSQHTCIMMSIVINNKTYDVHILYSYVMMSHTLSLLCRFLFSFIHSMSVDYNTLSFYLINCYLFYSIDTTTTTTTTTTITIAGSSVRRTIKRHPS